MKWKTFVALLILLLMFPTLGLASISGNVRTDQGHLSRPALWRPTPTGLYENLTRTPQPTATPVPDDTTPPSPAPTSTPIPPETEPVEEATATPVSVEQDTEEPTEEASPATATPEGTSPATATPEGTQPSTVMPGETLPATVPAEGTPSPTGMAEETPTATVPAEGTITATIPAEGTPTATIPIEGTPSPTAVPEETEAPSQSLLAAYSQFASYRLVSALSWDLDSGHRGNADIVTEVINDTTPAQRWTIDLRQEEESPITIEFIHARGQTYVRVNDLVQPAPANLSNLLQRVRWLARPEEVLDLDAGTLVGTEVVNGMEADHYLYENEAFAPAREHIDLTWAQADLWVSTEYGIYVRAIVQVIGSDDQGNSGVVALQSDLVGVNVPLRIELPTPVNTIQQTSLTLSEALGMEAFDSYRMVNTVHWNLASGLQGRADMEAAVNQGQPAEQAVIRLRMGNADQEIDYIHIDGQPYIRRGGAWMSAAGLPLDAVVAELRWLTRPRELLGDSPGTFVGFEMLNGLMTRHYRYDQAALQSIPWLTNTSQAQADLWLWNQSPDQEACVRIVLHAEGSDSWNLPGEVDLISSIVDINAPLSIQRPLDLMLE